MGVSYCHLETSKTFSENLDLTLSYSYSHSSTLIQSYAHTSGLKYETLFFGNLIEGLFPKSRHHTLILGAEVPYFKDLPFTWDKNRIDRIGALSSIY